MGGMGGPPSGQPPYMPPPTMLPQPGLAPQPHHMMGPSGMAASPMAHHAQQPPASYSPAPTLSYDVVAAQTPEFNTTVYVGNLIPYVSQADLIPLFQGYGYIVEIRMQADRGFAFVKLDSHHNAAMAITHLQNSPVHGRGIKCSWGKDKGPDGTGSTSPLPAPTQYQAPAVGFASPSLCLQSLTPLASSIPRLRRLLWWTIPSIRSSRCRSTTRIGNR
jgi:nucleolysin TIA-1/TIAR